MDQTRKIRTKNNLRTKDKSKIIKGISLPKTFKKINKPIKTTTNLKLDKNDPKIEFRDEPLNPELNMGFDLDFPLIDKATDSFFNSKDQDSFKKLGKYENESDKNTQIMISGYSYSSTYQNGQQLEEESKLHIKNDHGYYMHRDNKGKVTKKVLKPNEIDEFICQSFNNSGLPCPYKAKYIQSGGKAVCGYHKTKQLRIK